MSTFDVLLGRDGADFGDRLFFPPVVETEEATTNGTGNKETEEKSDKEETPEDTKETDENTDTKETSNTNGGKQDDSGDESWEEVEMEKSELELKLEAEAEEVAQKLPDPPTSDPAEVEEEKKKGE